MRNIPDTGARDRKLQLSVLKLKVRTAAWEYYGIIYSYILIRIRIKLDGDGVRTAANIAPYGISPLSNGGLRNRGGVALARKLERGIDT